MSEYVEIPGSGVIRTTTSEDVNRARALVASARPVHRQAITASAVKLNRRDESSYHRRMSEPWQWQCLFHYEVIPELHFASHFIARMLSRVRYFPARLGPDSKLTEITEGPPVERLNRIQDPGGGRSQVQYRYGLLQFVTGEGVLFGYDLDSERQKWKFLWKDEVKLGDNGDAVRLNFEKKETNERGVGYRFWTPSPRHSDLADSPVRAVLQICEELLRLTDSVMSTATTRMTNGIMVFPSELSPNPLEPVGDEDPENNIFLADYIEHVSNQKENPGSAEAAVPFLLEAAYEYIDRVRWISTHDAQTDYMERELRKEAVQRMALGLDMPPEALLGMTDANHWTAKQVMHDMWRSHGVPKAEQFADDLSEAYLRPALEEDEYEGWEDVVIGLDDSQVVISPDRTEDADKALDRIAIGFAGYRELKGIPEDFAPTDEEKEFLATLKIRQPVTLDDGELIIAQRGPVAGENGNAPEDGPAQPTAGRTGARQESLRASGEILGAARMALHRCREVAGAKLRTQQRDCAECQEKTDGLPNAVVASVLGTEYVTEIADPLSLVAGGADGFRTVLVEDGMDATQAAGLAQMIEVFAARTLFEQTAPTLPAGFIAQVEKAREISDVITA